MRGRRFLRADARDVRRLLRCTSKPSARRSRAVARSLVPNFWSTVDAMITAPAIRAHLAALRPVQTTKGASLLAADVS